MVRAQTITVLGLGMLLLAAVQASAEINSGSTGADGAFHPTQSVTVDMRDRPDGIYHYTTVNIPSGVTVDFVPNEANTPVVWLVQGDCVIGGSVSVDGKGPSLADGLGGKTGALGGPGGYAGGNGKLNPDTRASAGHGPGGGTIGPEPGLAGGNASYCTEGQVGSFQYAPGEVYGNQYMLPLIGGSGGAGGEIQSGIGGGGGGGAILIVSSTRIVVSGQVRARGGSGWFTGGFNDAYGSGGGSGGAIRLVAPTVTGTGSLYAMGGAGGAVYYTSPAGDGWTRIDAYEDTFTRSVTSRGLYPIIMLPENVMPRLRITRIAGIEVPANPSGSPSKPDVLIPGTSSNPMTVEVSCENIPSNTQVTVEVKPSSGPMVKGVATNSGTLASSTAVVSLNIPRGGGTISAKAVSGVVPSKTLAAADAKDLSVWDTGLAANGEKFVSIQVSSTAGGPQETVLVTESGMSIPLESGASLKSEEEGS